MSSRPHKRKKNCRDLVMNQMEKLKSARKKSRLYSILLTISKLETKITETNLCRVLKVQTWSASKSQRISVEQLVKHCSENEETCNNCSRTSRLLQESSMRSEQKRMSLMLAIMKLWQTGRELSRRLKMLQVNFRGLNKLRKPNLTMCALSKELNSINLLRI